jgi:hypothetical protein
VRRKRSGSGDEFASVHAPYREYLVFALNKHGSKGLDDDPKELGLVSLQEAMNALEKLSADSGEILPVLEKLKRLGRVLINPAL